MLKHVCAFCAAGRDGPAQPTLDDFQSLVLNHSRLQIKLKDVLWQSAFSINERVVSRRDEAAKPGLHVPV